MQYPPCDILKPFVKSISIVTIERNIHQEIFYPSGFMDLVIKISNGDCATSIAGRRRDTPEVELLGHLTVPTTVSASKGSSILIIRFYPYACSLFFANPIVDFTNLATDLFDVHPADADKLYTQMMEANSMHQKINTVEAYLIENLKKSEDRAKKCLQVAAMCNFLFRQHEYFDLKAIAKEFHLSERYIQKQFLEIAGLQPTKLYSTYRFNRSLHHVVSSNTDLTSISYDCGYFDQAHFIHEFKKFTGITPSEARGILTQNGDKFQRAVNIGV